MGILVHTAETETATTPYYHTVCLVDGRHFRALRPHITRPTALLQRFGILYLRGTLRRPVQKGSYRRGYVSPHPTQWAPHRSSSSSRPPPPV